MSWSHRNDLQQKNVSGGPRRNAGVGMLKRCSNLRRSRSAGYHMPRARSLPHLPPISISLSCRGISACPAITGTRKKSFLPNHLRISRGCIASLKKEGALTGAQLQSLLDQLFIEGVAHRSPNRSPPSNRDIENQRVARLLDEISSDALRWRSGKDPAAIHADVASLWLTDVTERFNRCHR